MLFLWLHSAQRYAQTYNIISEQRISKNIAVNDNSQIVSDTSSYELENFDVSILGETYTCSVIIYSGYKQLILNNYFSTAGMYIDLMSTWLI